MGLFLSHVYFITALSVTYWQLKHINKMVEISNHIQVARIEAYFCLSFSKTYFTCIEYIVERLLSRAMLIIIDRRKHVDPTWICYYACVWTMTYRLLKILKTLWDAQERLQLLKYLVFRLLVVTFSTLVPSKFIVLKYFL